MRRILVVGYLEYDKKKDLAELNPDALLIFDNAIYNRNNPQVIIAVVNMVDEVMFVDNTDRIQYEIACIMLKKTFSDYEGKKDGESV